MTVGMNGATIPACIGTPHSTRNSLTNASRSFATELESAVSAHFGGRISSLRLQNGIYVQKHRADAALAIPHGLLAFAPPAHVRARRPQVRPPRYAHFTTRQNIQYNWPELWSGTDILADQRPCRCTPFKPKRQLHPNTTTDQFAGIAPDEVVNPLVWARSSGSGAPSTLSSLFLPRKFKIAISGATIERAATLVHDIIGLVALRRTPPQYWLMPPSVVVRPHAHRRHRDPRFRAMATLDHPSRSDPARHNHLGRRDNKYKARIKILVGNRRRHSSPTGSKPNRSHQKEWADALSQAEVDAIAYRFTWPT